MNSPKLTYRALAVALVVTVQMLYAPASAAPATATLTGEVFSADARLPMPGVIVRVVNPGTGDLYTSVPTDDKGAFELRSLPAAVYSVAVQQGHGVFAAAGPIVLAPGEHRSVQVALYEQEAAPSPAEAQSTTYKTSAWENPLTATLIALGIAVVVGYAAEEVFGSDGKKTSSSPSQPN